MALPSPAPIGKKFSRLLVIAEAERRRKPSGNTTRFMRCQCDCGTIKDVSLEKLKNGETGSCGCLHIDRTIEASTKHGNASKDSQKRTKEYQTWAHIKQRCTNPKNKSYKHYGGRGISICDKWLNSFEAFLADVGKAPDRSPDISIDRIDNERGYEPGNVRWATRSMQNKNRRSFHGTQKLPIESHR